jgi:hypothetical protein
MVSRLGYCILGTRDSIQRTRLWLLRGGTSMIYLKISLYLIYPFLLYCDLYCAYFAACALLRVDCAWLRVDCAWLRVDCAWLRLEHPECWWAESTESGASLPVFTINQDTPVLHCVKEALKASGAVDDGAGDFVDHPSSHKDSVTAVARGVVPSCDCPKCVILIVFIGNVVSRDHMLGGQGNTEYGNMEVWHKSKYRCNTCIANNLKWIVYHQSLLKILTGVYRWKVKVTHADIH